MSILFPYKSSNGIYIYIYDICIYVARLHAQKLNFTTIAQLGTLWRRLTLYKNRYNTELYKETGLVLST